MYVSSEGARVLVLGPAVGVDGGGVDGGGVDGGGVSGVGGVDGVGGVCGVDGVGGVGEVARRFAAMNSPAGPSPGAAAGVTPPPHAVAADSPGELQAMGDTKGGVVNIGGQAAQSPARHMLHARAHAPPRAPTSSPRPAAHGRRVMRAPHT